MSLKHEFESRQSTLEGKWKLKEQRLERLQSQIQAFQQVPHQCLHSPSLFLLLLHLLISSSPTIILIRSLQDIDAQRREVELQLKAVNSSKAEMDSKQRSLEELQLELSQHEEELSKKSAHLEREQETLRVQRQHLEEQISYHQQLQQQILQQQEAHQLALQEERHQLNQALEQLSNERKQLQEEREQVKTEREQLQQEQEQLRLSKHRFARETEEVANMSKVTPVKKEVEKQTDKSDQDKENISLAGETPPCVGEVGTSAKLPPTTSSAVPHSKKRSRKKKAPKQHEHAAAKGAAISSEQDRETKRSTLLEKAKLQRLRQAQNTVRVRVVKELLQTEESYVNSLQLLEKFIVQPLDQSLRKGGAPILTRRETAVVGSNIPSLLSSHRKLLEVLRERINSWDDSSVIGDVFLESTDFLLALYSCYANSYNAAVAAVKDLVRRKPAFQTLVHRLEQSQAKSSCLDLESFLIMPVQRIPRYLMLLQNLLKYTPDGHPDHHNLRRALDLLQERLVRINQEVDESNEVNLSRLQSISDQMAGNFESIICPGRRFLKEGELYLEDTRSGDHTSSKKMKQMMTCFIFNDLAVLARKRDDNSSNTSAAAPPFVHFRSIFSEDIEVASESYVPVKSKRRFKKLDLAASFNLKFKTGESWNILVHNQTENLLWVSLFQQLMSSIST